MILLIVLTSFSTILFLILFLQNYRKVIIMRKLLLECKDTSQKQIDLLEELHQLNKILLNTLIENEKNKEV